MSNGNNSGGEDEILMILLIGGVVIGLGFLVWHVFKPQITDGVRWLRVGEMTLSEQFVPKGYAVQYGDRSAPVSMVQMKTFMQNAPVSQITTAHLGVASDIAQRELRIPIAIILLLAAGFVYAKGPHTKFKKVHTLETLIQAQAKTFPYIRPIIDFNPAQMPNRAPGDPVPAKLPLFAEALAPEEWVAYKRLPMPGGKLDEAATSAALAEQLGGRWLGWKKLAPWQQVLLAAFAMRAARKRNESDLILGRLSSCWSSKGGLSLGRDAKLLGDARAFLRSKASEKTMTVLRQHAWVTTAMMRAIDFARSQGGVLSPGQFVWLRGHDRNLWYPLNNMGRQAYHPEALGAMSHFKLEKMTQRPVPVPKTDSALAALKTYFASALARPIPPLDYGKGDIRSAQPKAGRKAGIMKPAA